MLKKVLFFTNIPSPYRIDFFNDLSASVDLTVVFEGRRAHGARFNWNDDQLKFKAVLLKDGEMNERKVDPQIFRYVRRKDYDYIFFTNYGYYTELAALFLAKVKKIPYIQEFDGAVYKNESTMRKAGKSMIIRGANRYFSPNMLTDEVLGHYGVSKEKIYRYPFSSIREKDIRADVVTDAEKERLRTELGVREKRNIICVGQFIHRKGIDLLLKALPSVPGDVGVHIVGGQATGEYGALVRENRLDNVHFVNFLNNNALNKYYDMADLFVLPTREDIWGLVVNEAMARGLPIITTDNCGAGVELVRDNGVIIPTESVDELAKAINNCISDKRLLSQMSAQSLKIIKAYTIESMVKAHLAYFDADC